MNYDVIADDAFGKSRAASDARALPQYRPFDRRAALDLATLIHNCVPPFPAQKFQADGQIPLNRAQFAPRTVAAGDVRGDVFAVGHRLRIHVAHGSREDPARNVIEYPRLEDMYSGEHQRRTRIVD